MSQWVSQSVSHVWTFFQLLFLEGESIGIDILYMDGSRIHLGTTLKWSGVDPTTSPDAFRRTPDTGIKKISKKKKYIYFLLILINFDFWHGSESIRPPGRISPKTGHLENFQKKKNIFFLFFFFLLILIFDMVRSRSDHLDAFRRTLGTYGPESIWPPGRISPKTGHLYAYLFWLLFLDIGVS